ncbi:hypothetical protein [Deinococcus sp.]|uniref:hypothetical protein n=1 Tax=Deinococcus sp. TaxID=47478 RepID=UPI00286E80CC|nr:hypothetical protein [Deinococcus sp.]
MPHLRFTVIVSAALTFLELASAAGAASPPPTREAFENSAFCKKYSCQPGNIYETEPGVRGYFYSLQGKEDVSAVIQVRSSGGFVLAYLDVQLNKATGALDMRSFAGKFRPLMQALNVQILGTSPALDLLKLCTKTHTTRLKVRGKFYTFDCEEATGEGIYTISTKQ